MSDPVTDQKQLFLREAGKIASNAQLVIDSFPNAEWAAAERSLRQLLAVLTVLFHFDDPLTSDETLEQLKEFTSGLITRLDTFLSAPPVRRNMDTAKEHTGRKGRPRYALDIERAIALHGLGNSWKEVADAMGVTRPTLYNHMRRAGLSTSRPQYTNISDDDLDEVVSKITLDHPFIGGIIVRGHLEANDIHISAQRVQECLRRVDAMGVLLRCACHLFSQTL